MPIFVRAFGEKEFLESPGRPADTTAAKGGGDTWIEGLEDNENDISDGQDAERPKSLTQNCKNEVRRKDLLKCVQDFWGSPVKLENIAHSIQPIRLDASARKISSSSHPRLQVDMVVCGPNESHHDDDDDDGNDDGMSSEEPVATIRLVRMVNRIPLLDGAEASACGLVQGVANKVVWGSFGLQVTKSSTSNADTAWIPVFHVQDSDQIAPFFQSRTHALWEASKDDHLEADDDDGGMDAALKKRKRATQDFLLPAKLRLGKILLIIQIHAQPSFLPLPTLSKVKKNVASPNGRTKLDTNCFFFLPGKASAESWTYRSGSSVGTTRLFTKHPKDKPKFAFDPATASTC